LFCKKETGLPFCLNKNISAINEALPGALIGGGSAVNGLHQKASASHSFVLSYLTGFVKTERLIL